MVNFLWKLAALTLVLFGGKQAERHMLFGMSYGMGWKKVFLHIWNKGRIKTVKPSGTVSKLDGTSGGIHPPYKSHMQAVDDIFHRDYYGKGSS